MLTSQCDVSLFHTTADWLKKKLDISFNKQEEEDGCIIGKFIFSDELMMLRYNPATGVSICPEKMTKSDNSGKEAFTMYAKKLNLI